jgi:hypothetical protein
MGLIPSAESRLTALDRVTITYQSALRQDADTRRTMVEVFSLPDVTIRDVKFLDILPPAPGSKTVIGGHWEMGLEIQYVLSGKIARLDLADVATRQEKTFVNIAAGSRIIMPAGVAHRSIYEEAALVLVCNEVPYMPEKCIVYPYETPLPDGQLNLTSHPPLAPEPNRTLPDLSTTL